MSSRVRRFLRALAYDALRGTADFIAVFIGCILAAALLMGAAYLLGWGVAALWRWGPTTPEDRGWGMAAGFVVGVGGMFAYACIRDLRRWLLRLWYDAGRKARGW